MSSSSLSSRKRKPTNSELSIDVIRSGLQELLDDFFDPSYNSLEVTQGKKTEYLSLLKYLVQTEPDQKEPGLYDFEFALTPILEKIFSEKWTYFYRNPDEVLDMVERIWEDETRPFALATVTDEKRKLVELDPRRRWLDLMHANKQIDREVKRRDSGRKERLLCF